MTTYSFTKALCFSDLHVGKKSDSELHNQDCLEFVDWIIQRYHEERCDAVIIMGDWFHNRVHVRWDTLWYSEQAVSRLSALGCPVYFLIGNHDLWFNHSREIHSHPGLHRVPNFLVINSITQVDDCLFCPYLMGSEYNIVTNTEARYVFGHFELPGFMTNETYMFESDRALKSEFIRGPEYLFSGHFHKRQIRKNANGTTIVYIGNCFAHDFNDVGDRDRGCMIFEREQEPRFINWPAAPNYNRTSLSKVLKLIEADRFPGPYNARSVVHVENDILLRDPELGEIREWLSTQGLREIKILPAPEPDLEPVSNQPVEIPRENITTFFESNLNQIDTEGSRYQVDLLQHLFRNTREKLDNGKDV